MSLKKFTFRVKFSQKVLLIVENSFLEGKEITFQSNEEKVKFIAIAEGF